VRDLENRTPTSIGKECVRDLEYQYIMRGGCGAKRYDFRRALFSLLTELFSLSQSAVHYLDMIAVGSVRT
jgi:hypothetical protein